MRLVLLLCLSLIKYFKFLCVCVSLGVVMTCVCVAVAVDMTLACAARIWTLQDVLMHGQDYRQTDSGTRVCTHSLEGFGLCEDIQTDCDDEGTDRSHDLSHRTLGRTLDFLLL
ncbi:hypothetical protein INR49_007500 [Caranx melampygus]|nr:hypothetical protein INR49_007500 [Caranx melampygus]